MSRAISLGSGVALHGERRTAYADRRMLARSTLPRAGSAVRRLRRIWWRCAERWTSAAPSTLWSVVLPSLPPVSRAWPPMQTCWWRWTWRTKPGSIQPCPPFRTVPFGNSCRTSFNNTASFGRRAKPAGRVLQDLGLRGACL